MSKEFLSRVEAAEYLTQKGFKTSPKTLAKLACIGGGPEFQKYGSRILYTPPNLDRYAESRLSAPMRSTSEAA